ncbi:signal peptide peptidase SppA [Altericroceibacterium xinjiangense]|uniref:signal peptide peptidase SppA n=1 Tax=Altericroceibacterium xinjiangense TaxID=762261 RepID=UPI000F7F05F3|nr:signal peptide peptidase SppA [Altericroceibacterium xinjiangense]
MSFAGKVWRLLVGIKDALTLILLLLFFSALFMLLSARPNAAAVRDGALLLDLDGSVVEEKAPADPLAALISSPVPLLTSAVPTKEYVARDLVRAIDEGARDERIKVIALDMTQFLGGGQVHMASIAEALDRFRAAGKPVIAYAVGYTDDAMMLAAHSSEVWVDPMGGVAISGPGGHRLYYGALLERLNINAHVFRVGTYKSAVEPYIRTDMSPEARENATQLYGSLWQEWLANVKQARPQADLDRVTTDIATWIDQNGGNLAQAAISAGLADKIGDHVEWGKRVAQFAGEDEWDKSPGSFARTEFDPWLEEVGPEDIGGEIGVITIAGPISDGHAGPGEAGAERIAQALDDALEDNLKALVVRVDSPGGTVTGGEAIRRAILRHKEKGIPIAVSMGNVAASGGYWVATPADRIFAEPETITGSIGVFGVVPTFENALAEWNVQSDGVRTTPLSGQPDLFAGFTPETEAVLQKSVEFAYDRFLTLVAQSRGMSKAQVDQLAQGRVWDGGSARQLGLVDQFGDLDAALEWAAARADLPAGQWHPKFLGQEVDPYEQWLASALGEDTRAPEGPRDLFGQFAQSQQQLSTRIAEDLSGLLRVRGAQARCLECPQSHSTARSDGAGGMALERLFLRMLFD